MAVSVGLELDQWAAGRGGGCRARPDRPCAVWGPNWVQEGGQIQGQLDPRARGRRTHLCVCCGFPIAVYGRCAPCLHVYCLTCASDMAVCLM